MLQPELENRISHYVETHARLLFLVLDRDGVILHANQHALRVIGPQLCGRQFIEVLIDFSRTLRFADLVEVDSGVRRLNVKTTTGLPQTFDFMFTHSEAQILAFGQVNSDELETLRRELLSLTGELSTLSRELEKRNAELRRLNQLKNEFLGMAAHDLRRPASIVLNYAEFIGDEIAASTDNNQREYLETIRHAAESMSHIIDDFLDVSMIEAGKFSLDIQPHDAQVVLENSLCVGRLQAAKKGVRLEVETEDSLRPVWLDGPKIEQVITNLVANAIEHSPTGTSVRIAMNANGESMNVSVADSGSGVVPGERERLFNPFQQGCARKTAGERSTGLGLAIARKIIECHGGTIGVDSPEGEGATFFFSLPKDTRAGSPG
jgi:signal transduction histidine kinase